VIALGYIRVSKARDDMVSPEVQKDEIQRFADQKGWTVADWYTDLDISGRTDERPALQEMLDRAVTGGAEAVVFYRLDRFSRNPAHHYAMLALLRNAGVLVDSVHQPYEDSPEGEFRWGLEAVLAQYESLRLGARLRDAHRRLARQGRWNGGTVPYGFQRVQDERGVRLVADPEEAKWRLWIHEQYHSGWGAGRIARELNRREIPTQRGRTWERHTVEVILFGAVQVGAREVDGELVFGGNIEPIVPLEMFERTLQMKEARRRKPREGRPPRTPLTGRHLRCANCGNRLYSRWHHKPSDLYFQCHGRQKAICDRGVAIQAARLIPYVEERLFERLQQAYAPKVRKDPAPVPPLKEEVRDVEEVLGRLAVMYAGGELLEAEYRAARQTQLRKLERARAKLEKALQRTEALVQADLLEETWRDLGRITKAQWDALSIQAQRDIYDLVLDRVIVSPMGQGPRIRVYWK